tara:strand:+ start:458 stop:694 length:237 start_codon:yes stop_codon:yes gene_type:complete
MTTKEVHKLRVIHNWLKEIIQDCEYEAYGTGEPDDINLDQHILPFLRDQEQAYLNKLTNAEDKLNNDFTFKFKEENGE